MRNGTRPCTQVGVSQASASWSQKLLFRSETNYEGGPAGVYLQLWVFCQRHADSVSQAIHEQRTNTNCTLHAPILALSSLQARTGIM